ncbi:hypothetical protein THAOC_25477 [Thalassiosira oceanica]|uniref:Uncharacterized protein n=1 Tax=Thalassiosira oceanica TaxID=159749 RepID=K0RM98_THAOC|nr:hypothetical protein THAOC_25477 [Thalassiosira oceanica]|eukprot:EJK54858.1 hypothetical protein THAOC_25477 [Thalassiosira oceanica]
MSLDEETMMILSDMALYCSMTVVLASETMYERTLRKTVGKSQPPRRRSAHNSENNVDFNAHHTSPQPSYLPSSPPSPSSSSSPASGVRGDDGVYPAQPNALYTPTGQFD